MKIYERESKIPLVSCIPLIYFLIGRISSLCPFSVTQLEWLDLATQTIWQRRVASWCESPMFGFGTGKHNSTMILPWTKVSDCCLWHSIRGITYDLEATFELNLIFLSNKLCDHGKTLSLLSLALLLIKLEVTAPVVTTIGVIILVLWEHWDWRAGTAPLVMHDAIIRRLLNVLWWQTFIRYSQNQNSLSRTVPCHLCGISPSLNSLTVRTQAIDTERSKQWRGSKTYPTNVYPKFEPLHSQENNL